MPVLSCPETNLSEQTAIVPASAAGSPAQATWADDLFAVAQASTEPGKSALSPHGVLVPSSDSLQHSSCGQSAQACAPRLHEADPYYVAPSLFLEGDTTRTLPAYLCIFSLEELGMLYLFEHGPAMTRQAALRVAQNRGLDEESAHEVVDFHFMRKRPAFDACELAVGNSTEGGAPSEEPASSTQKPDRKRVRRRDDAAEPVVHVLGEAEETVCMLALKGQDQVALRTDLVEELTRCYPMLDVRMELVRMDQWLRANPEKRKTPRGVRRFINTWLSNASDRERMRRDMVGASAATRNGFGTGSGLSGSGNAAAATALSASRLQDETGDGLGDLLD